MLAGLPTSSGTSRMQRTFQPAAAPFDVTLAATSMFTPYTGRGSKDSVQGSSSAPDRRRVTPGARPSCLPSDAHVAHA